MEDNPLDLNQENKMKTKLTLTQTEICKLPRVFLANPKSPAGWVQSHIVRGVEVRDSYNYGTSTNPIGWTEYLLPDGRIVRMAHNNGAQAHYTLSILTINPDDFTVVSESECRRLPATKENYWRWEVEEGSGPLCLLLVGADGQQSTIQPSTRQNGGHLHLCLGCSAVVGIGDDCEGDGDHDFSLCTRCAAANEQ